MTEPVVSGPHTRLVQLAKLRDPFPPAAVGKLPKAGIKLDYVGHAAVTDRLLSVDPEWTWEPLALDERGLPAFDNKGGLWIRLTVCGVTRLGYGDGPDPKQRIGDAIRNAAMRFGVALDLWTKDELESALPSAAPDRIPADAPEDAHPSSGNSLEQPKASNREEGAQSVTAEANTTSSQLIGTAREGDGEHAPPVADHAIEKMQSTHLKKQIAALRDDDARAFIAFRKHNGLPLNADDFSDAQREVASSFFDTVKL